jgi:hypothetical protein
MRRISAPGISPEPLYDRVSGARRLIDVRGRLEGARPRVLAAYDTYVAARPDVAVLAQADTGPATDTDLKGNYDYLVNSTQERATRAELLAGAVHGKCPLCDQGSVTTLDHFLPRNAFPEFSILPINLVPACGKCNHLKREIYQENGLGVFVHAYFDDLPNAQYLFADVSVEHGEILASFRISPPAQMDPGLARRLGSHFRLLRLADYYRLEAMDELSERRQRLLDMVEEGATVDDLADHLVRDAAAARRARGENHWRYALLAALAGNADVCAGRFRR